MYFSSFFFGVLGHLFKQLYPCVLSGVGECECVRLLSVAQDWGLWTHRSIDGTFEWVFTKTHFEQKREIGTRPTQLLFTLGRARQTESCQLLQALCCCLAGESLLKTPAYTRTPIFMYNQFVLLPFYFIFFFWQYLFKNLWSFCSGKSGLGIYLINPKFLPRKSASKRQLSPFFLRMTAKLSFKCFMSAAWFQMISISVWCLCSFFLHFFFFCYVLQFPRTHTHK